MRLLIAGGGTGGHLFPGVAVAETLKERDPDSRVMFVGTVRGIEARELPRLGWALSTISAKGVKTKGFKGAIKGLLSVPKAMLESRKILRGFRPEVVLGVGGYASAPVVAMAWLMGIPTAVMEQNSMPGLANRWLGKVVKGIFLTFEQSAKFFPEGRVVMSGNPVRLSISKPMLLARNARVTHTRPCVLILGGSQGAVAVNTAVVEAMKVLAARNQCPDIIHHTGKTGYADTVKAYAAANIRATCHEFITDMASAYKAADIVIARAGATTVAELELCGLPAIFIPYPHAADNHQELNAAALVESGASIMFREFELSPAKLADAIQGLLSNRNRLDGMRSAMKHMAKGNAADAILDWCTYQAKAYSDRVS